MRASLGQKTVLYFYEGAFTLWRRRMIGVCEGARKVGWQVYPVNVDGLNENARRAIAFWRPVGAIVDGGALLHRGFGVAHFRDLPTVFCDADEWYLKAPYYGLHHDSRDTARKAAAELLALNCESYGYVHYFTPRDWSDERCAELGSVARRAGAPFQSFDSSKARRGADIGLFLKRLANFLLGLPRPAGVLAANDEMAANVLAAATLAGLAVPEDLAVVGIDDDDLICESTVPTLTSVAPDFERSGRMAVELLVRCIAEGGRNPEILDYGTTDLVCRRSTRLFSARDPRVVRAVEFIRRNACTAMTAKDVVEAMGMRPRSAESRFKRVCGHSIRDEILAARLVQAKRLLAETDIPVSQVCVHCGYGDERSLRYMFTKATGVSPYEWRVTHCRK